jgi:hypothetical protein
VHRQVRSISIQAGKATKAKMPLVVLT